MAKLDLILRATEYDQLVDPDDVRKGTRRYRAGDEFTAHDQDEYDRLTATDKYNRPAAVPPDAPDPRDASKLAGKDLESALERFGLSTDGRADDKRARVQEYLDANADASLTPAP